VIGILTWETVAREVRMAEAWSQARQIGYQYVESLVRAEWGATDIVTTLTDYGVGYRWSDMFDDIRALRGLAVSSQYVKRLELDEYVPRRYIGETVPERWHQPEKLRYRMEAVFRDPETGEESIEYRALMTDEEMTKGAVLQYTQEEFPWDTYGEGKELVGLELVGLYHLKGTSY